MVVDEHGRKTGGEDVMSENVSVFAQMSAMTECLTIIERGQSEKRVFVGVDSEECMRSRYEDSLVIIICWENSWCWDELIEIERRSSSDWNVGEDVECVDRACEGRRSFSKIRCRMDEEAEVVILERVFDFRQLEKKRSSVNYISRKVMFQERWNCELECGYLCVEYVNVCVAHGDVFK